MHRNHALFGWFLLTQASSWGCLKSALFCDLTPVPNYLRKRTNRNYYSIISHAWDGNQYHLLLTSWWSGTRMMLIIFSHNMPISAPERLTHWGRVTHKCVGNVNIIGSDNKLSPGWRQDITWTSAGISLIRPVGANFNEILNEIYIFLFKKMHLKMLSVKWRPFCFGLN